MQKKPRWYTQSSAVTELTSWSYVTHRRIYAESILLFSSCILCDKQYNYKRSQIIPYAGYPDKWLTRQDV